MQFESNKPCSQADYTYLNILQQLLVKHDLDGINPERTGTGATNIFGAQMRFQLDMGFPILTTKSVHWHSIVGELLWFLRGDTNIKYLVENNIHIWTDWPLKKFNEYRTQLGKDTVTAAEFEKAIIEDDEFAKQWGDIGKAYGHQWRNFGEVNHNFAVDEMVNGPYRKGFDQISWVINEIKTNPTSRRLIVTGWNPHEVDKAALPPCHTLFQFFVEPLTHAERVNKVLGKMPEMIDEYTQLHSIPFKNGDDISHFSNDMLDYYKVPKGRLSCQLYQRSADYFLGVPFNIASYALLTHIVAAECGLDVGEFIWTGGVVHLYSNHVEQAEEQLRREPKAPARLKEFVPMALDSYEISDFQLENYQPHPRIPAPVAV